MTTLIALSVSIAVLGGLATWLALGPLSGFILIWTVFVAWGAFFALGGDDKALKNTIVCGIFGVICAWLTALVILAIPLAAVLTLPVWAAIVVAISILLLCLAAHVGFLSAIPATVFGYASTFAYLLQTQHQLSVKALTAASTGNALFLMSVSIIVGAVFGLVSGKLAGALGPKAA